MVSPEVDEDLEQTIGDNDIVHLVCDCQLDDQGDPVTDPLISMCGNQDQDPELIESPTHEFIECPLCWEAQFCPACGSQ